VAILVFQYHFSTIPYIYHTTLVLVSWGSAGHILHMESIWAYFEDSMTNAHAKIEFEIVPRRKRDAKKGKVKLKPLSAIANN